MDYLRFLLLGNTLRGQYLESEHLLRSVLEKRRVCLFTSSRSASSPAVSNSMTQTQTQTGSGELATTENLLHLAPGPDHPGAGKRTSKLESNGSVQRRNGKHSR